MTGMQAGAGYNVEGDIAAALSILAEPTEETTGVQGDGVDGQQVPDAGNLEQPGVDGDTGGTVQTPAEPAAAPATPTTPADGSAPAEPTAEPAAPATPPAEEEPDLSTMSRGQLAEHAKKAEKRRRDLESFSHRQLEELKAQHAAQLQETAEKTRQEVQAQVQQQLQGWQQQQAQLAQQQAAAQAQARQTAQTQNVTDEQLAAAITTGPVDALKWVINNRPDLAGRAVAHITKIHGPEMGAEAQAGVQQAMLDRQAQNFEQRQAALIARQEAPGQLRQGITAVIGHVANTVGVDKFTSVAPRVQALITEGWNDFQTQHPDLHPNALQSYVLEKYTLAREEAIELAKAQPRQAVPLAPTERVDGGNNGNAPTRAPAGTTPDEDEVDHVKEMVDAYQAHGYR